jgi:hypothetical protein
VIQRFAYVHRAANGVEEPRPRSIERAAALDPLAKGREQWLNR